MPRVEGAIVVGDVLKRLVIQERPQRLLCDQSDADVLATPASGPHLRQGDVKRKGADLLVAPLKLNVRLSKCGPRSVEPLRGS